MRFVLTQLSPWDRAVGTDHPAAGSDPNRETSRSRRVAARCAASARHVWRSWPLVVLAAIGLSACAAPAGDGEGTAMTRSDLSAGDEDVTVEALVAKLQHCTKASHTAFATDSGGSAKIDICKLKNAVFFKADMDIDCDGKKSTHCNSSTDHSWQNQTAALDSNGKPLDAATVPYIVVPGESTRWNFADAGIAIGSVGAVIYNGKLTFGVVGDIGPKAIIGEASYAMADSLDINPDPAVGGVDSGVSYILFTGPSAILHKNEDHGEAFSVGMRRAAQLLAEN
jgi:hypothetical protein